MNTPRFATADRAEIDRAKAWGELGPQLVEALRSARPTVLRARDDATQGWLRDTRQQILDTVEEALRAADAIQSDGDGK